MLRSASQSVCESILTAHALGSVADFFNAVMLHCIVPERHSEFSLHSVCLNIQYCKFDIVARGIAPLADIIVAYHL